VAGCPEPVCVACGEPAAIDVDLVIDELEVVLYLGELGRHLAAVGLQEGESFLLVAGPGGYQLGIAPDGLDGNAGGPQPGADADPVEVELGADFFARRLDPDREARRLKLCPLRP
jgi:hypothetical protein